jgi:hypothetical protein
MPRMQFRLAATLIAAVTSGIAGAAESCDRAALLAVLPNAPALKAAPDISKRPDNLISRFSLSGSPLTMDGFKYDAVVNSTAGKVWFVRYGGFAGGVQWSGPVVVAPNAYSDCAKPLPFRLGHWQVPAELPPVRGTTQ